MRSFALLLVAIMAIIAINYWKSPLLCHPTHFLFLPGTVTPSRRAQMQSSSLFTGIWFNSGAKHSLKQQESLNQFFHKVCKVLYHGNMNFSVLSTPPRFKETLLPVFPNCCYRLREDRALLLSNHGFSWFPGVSAKAWKMPLLGPKTHPKRP